MTHTLGSVKIEVGELLKSESDAGSYNPSPWLRKWCSLRNTLGRLMLSLELKYSLSQNHHLTLDVILESAPRTRLLSQWSLCPLGQLSESTEKVLRYQLGVSRWLSHSSVLNTWLPYHLRVHPQLDWCDKTKAASWVLMSWPEVTKTMAECTLRNWKLGNSSQH